MSNINALQLWVTLPRDFAAVQSLILHGQALTEIAPGAILARRRADAPTRLARVAERGGLATATLPAAPHDYVLCATKPPRYCGAV